MKVIVSAIVLSGCAASGAIPFRPTSDSDASRLAIVTPADGGPIRGSSDGGVEIFLPNEGWVQIEEAPE